MILRFDSRLAFVALFGAAQILGACAKKKRTKSSDSVETPTADASGGEQTPPPDDDGGGEDAPGDPTDKSVDDGKKPPEVKPTVPPADPVPPSPYGQTVEANLASIQTKLLDVYCVSCHSGATPKKGLDLTSLAAHLDGTSQDTYEGRLIVPGAAELSMLALVLDSELEHDEFIPLMPPVAAGIPAVTAAQVQAVKAFINALPDQGAADVTDVGGDGQDAGDGGQDADDGGGDDRSDSIDPT